MRDSTYGGVDRPRRVTRCCWSPDRPPGTSAAFDPADVFDIDRTPSLALGFGFGIHTCLGAALARMESRLAIEALARRWPRFEVDEARLRAGADVQRGRLLPRPGAPGVLTATGDRAADRVGSGSVGPWGVDAERVVFTGFEGVQLVADVRGDPDGWPVLLLHGGGQTRHAWGTAAERIADEGWRTVSLDLRGHGESDWAPRGDYSFTAFGGDVVSVADQLGRPPVLVGRRSAGCPPSMPRGRATGWCRPAWFWWTSP